MGKWVDANGIEFDFEKETTQVFEWKNKLFGRKVKYAGVYTMCNMYEQTDIEKLLLIESGIHIKI